MASALNARIGFFLAVRQIRRSNLWTTSLIIFVMVLTFLNLVVVSGVLVGLLQGAINEARTQYTSDVILSSLNDKQYIDGSQNIVALVSSLPEVASVSPRYMEGGTVEANYQTRKSSDKPNVATAQMVGIDPAAEDATTHLSRLVVKGSYLQPGDYDKVLVGSYLLKQYLPVDNPNFTALENVDVGTKIRMNVNGISHEVTVAGIIKSKVQSITLNVYMVGSQLRDIIGRQDGNVAQIAIQLKSGADPVQVRNTLVQLGVDKNAKVQTYADAQPQFLKDVINTFRTLGNALSSIGLVVASITIFIVIFINAITRRKFIGILKGIGVKGSVIEISYIFQSIFYALCGSLIGLGIVYFLLVPYFNAHPIDFPFSNGILVAPPLETFSRMALLIAATLVAGYIPSRMIVRKNTLDSILGRN